MIVELFGFNEKLERIYTNLFNEILAETCKHLNISEALQTSATLVTKRQIKKANKNFRGINKVTDVLSFPTIDLSPSDKATLGDMLTKHNYPYDIIPETGNLFVGNILLCFSVIKKQAKKYNNTLMREMSYMTVHSILHLLGFDHANESDKKSMREVEEVVLDKLSLSRN